MTAASFISGVSSVFIGSRDFSLTESDRGPPLTCAQIARRWALNVSIIVVVLSLLAVLVLYFGESFTREGNRTFFIILVVIGVLLIVLALIFCKNPGDGKNEQSKLQRNNNHNGGNQRVDSGLHEEV